MSTSITVNGDRFINDAYDRIGKCLGTLQLNTNGSWFQRREYLWLDDQPIAQIVTSYGANNTVTSRRLAYIHTDHLNTPRLMTDASQTVVWRWDRDAFGFHNPDENPDGLAPSDRLDLRLPGQIRDVNSGLYYNYYRDYDPASGRYMQSDPIGLRGGLNTYSYVDGNPTSLIDPLGLAAQIACELQLKSCRAQCGRRPILSGPCLIQCEEKYGALGGCQPPPPPPPPPTSQCPPKRDPEPNPSAPECTYEQWRLGLCK